MSTYKEKLDYTEETKNLIKTAITNKGVAVGEGDTFRSYAKKIDSIPAARPMGSIKIKTKDIPYTELYEREALNLADCIESIDWTEYNKFGITNMNGMFQYWQGKTLDIANLSTTGVTDMSWMFHNSSINSLNLSNFDTSQVTDMSSMFSHSSVRSIDLSSFNTSQVTDMSYMFSYCQGFETLDVSSFDTSKVTDMNNMFNYCWNTKSIIGTENFNISQVTNMSNMFSYCPSLTSLNLSGWNISNVMDMDSMFYDTRALTSLNLTNFVFGKKVFRIPTSLDEIIGLNTVDTSQVTDTSSMFLQCAKFTSLDVSGWDTRNVINMDGMFNSCSNLVTLNLSGINTDKVNNFGNIIGGCNNIENVIWGNNWGACPDLSSFTTGPRPKLTKASILDLLNKLAPRTNSPTLTLYGANYDDLSPDELAIAQNKGWTVARG